METWSGDPITEADIRKRLEKPRPKVLEKRDAASKRDAIDRQERAKCKARSHGLCEVYERIRGMRVWARCLRRATENHHLIGGIGRRNRGKSILAEHRIDVCPRCHADITGNVLVPENMTERYDAATVRYERIK
jgi:hypothetical protein